MIKQKKMKNIFLFKKKENNDNNKDNKIVYTPTDIVLTHKS